MYRAMKKLIITGSIGSGKSEICRYLKGRGFPVYDCDSHAKALYDEKPELLEALASMFGSGVPVKDGRLDRAGLAARIFADKGAREAVEAIVHPAVNADLALWLSFQEKSGAEIAVIESAIALRVPELLALADAVLFVDAALERRVARVTERSGITEAEVLARMQSQSTDAVDADYYILNDNTLDMLHRKTDEVVELFMKTKKK